MINFDKRLFFIFEELSMNVVCKIDSHSRNYDPMTAKFLSPDPIGFSGGDSNLYRYVRNNPTKFTDPSGLVVFYAGGSANAGVIGGGYGSWFGGAYGLKAPAYFSGSCACNVMAFFAYF